MRYTLARAGELAEASYTGKDHAVIGFQHKDSLSKHDVEAHLLRDGTLLIPGSNSVMDYVRYNLRVQRIGKGRLKLKNAPEGITWHQGFLAHAKVVHDWLLEKGHQPTFLIGHSLGAASAQILSAGYNIPAVGFAAPRTCRTPAMAAAAKRCLLVNRTDDRICRLPSSFRHLGDVRACAPPRPTPGLNHSMPHYRRTVDREVPTGKLPRVWP